ncbi:MAG: hypothetical protein Q7T26_08755 [Dehalococcoidia bacterium]|nr:hypothetical protein [Dehalococcoidia bacterium]
MGTAITMTAEGLTPGQDVEFQWATANGSFAIKTDAGAVKYEQRVFKPRRIPLGRATVDAQGKATATFAAPDDFGEVHEIYAVAAGQDVAQGGFRTLRYATISPTEGPVGTPITITVTGMGWKPFEHSMGVLYDNKYGGYMSAVTTGGKAVFQIRAAGPPGQHTIRLHSAGKSIPYINIQQSPFSYLPQFDFVFTVTDDKGPPPDSVDKIDGSRVAVANAIVPGAIAKKTSVASGMTATLEPAAGAALSKATLRAQGLPPNVQLDLLWLTVQSSPNAPASWTPTTTTLTKVTTTPDGALTVDVQIPDDVGGWHAVRLAAGKDTIAEAPFYVERSVVSVTPRRVRMGDTFTIKIKGAGWTELDNGVAVTYDNAYIGNAIAQDGSGDITLRLTATGGSGTHLIDVYPMLQSGKDKTWWGYRLPFLTFAQDFPGMQLGYRLSAFRLAIEVTE